MTKLLPSSYPIPFALPAGTTWDDLPSDYDPPFFVHQTVIANDVTKNPKGWADPEDLNQVLKSRSLTSWTGPVRFNQHGMPLNPLGPRGIAGRGLLGKWGANFAADPILTRLAPNKTDFEVLLICRSDNGRWAIPGGMMDPGETPLQTAARELFEEAGVPQKLFLNASAQIFQGPLNDFRNTDNAWIETTAFHTHIPDLEFMPQAGTDAQTAAWKLLNDDTFQNLHANHADFLRLVANRLNSATFQN